MSRKPRVLVIAALGEPPYTGGIQNVVDTLVRSPLRESFEFSVFDTHRVADANRTWFAKAAYAARLPLQCRAALRAVKPDIVHIHFCSRTDFWKHATCLGVSRACAAKTVFHLHGGGFSDFLGEMSSLQRFVARCAFRAAHRTVALSGHWKDILSAVAPPKRISIVSNPVDCDALSPRPRAVDPDVPTILLLGRLERGKGHYDVLEALPAVLVRHPRARVLFAGADGEHGATEDLERRAQRAGLAPHVQFLGPVTLDPKVELLRTSTLMVLPSYAENMPLSILEAMAAGMPVVSTRVGAIPDVLDGGRAGLLIEPGDCEALAQSINQILGNPSWAARLGERAAERVRRLWDVTRITAQVEFLYREVLSRR